MQIGADERCCSARYLGSKRRFVAALATNAFSSQHCMTTDAGKSISVSGRAASCVLDFPKLQSYVHTAHSAQVEALMRSFILACLAAVAIAIVGAFALNSIQKSASVAFTTESVRV
jgi:hypothetical protein